MKMACMYIYIIMYIQSAFTFNNTYNVFIYQQNFVLKISKYKYNFSGLKMYKLVQQKINGRYMQYKNHKWIHMGLSTSNLLKWSIYINNIQLQKSNIYILLVLSSFTNFIISFDHFYNKNTSFSQLQSFSFKTINT